LPWRNSRIRFGMRRNIPPLNPVRIFETAARHTHFTRAADELCITQAAVSHQISVLEKWLGVSLFERRSNGLKLTPVGVRYLQSLRQAFDIIEDSTSGILSGPVRPKVTICAYSTFAQFWLMPRLSAFTNEHPDIEVDFLTSIASIAFRQDQADLIITHGIAKPQGIVSQKIFDDIIVPVCSPGFLQKHGPFSAGRLAETTLLHSRYRANDWAEWFSSLGVETEGRPGLVFSGSTLCYQAAKEGIGVAMGQLRLLDSEIACGNLVIPIDHRLARASGYFLLHSKHALQDPTITALRDWIIAEARIDRPIVAAVRVAS
jgi:LysR family transcriptional regulator, glycine cleavage system transcriptional activator